MHLTNYSLNKLTPEYQNPEEHEIHQHNKGSKRTLASLWDTLRNDPR